MAGIFVLDFEWLQELRNAVLLGTCVVAYVLGSIPFGYLIVKFVEGRDVRASGSGNIGAANVARTTGKLAGAVTLLLDAGKGFLAVWLGARYGTMFMAAAALCVTLGHMFSVWLKFNGGKGVATGAGAFLAICPPAIGGALLVWAATVGIWRYVSLASVTAAAALPILTYFFYAPGYAPPGTISGAAVAVAVLIIWKHRANFGRIAAGTEPKFRL